MGKIYIVVWNEYEIVAPFKSRDDSFRYLITEVTEHMKKYHYNVDEIEREINNITEDYNLYSDIFGSDSFGVYCFEKEIS